MAASPQQLLDLPASGRARHEPAHRHGFRHEVILHGDGAEGFVRQTAPLVEEALDRDAAVLVAVGPDRGALLREALGERSARVGFLEMRRLGANPARIIPAWREFLDSSGAGPEPLGVGEPVWPGRSVAELDECWRHEALLNVAFGAGRSWRLLCPYDVDSLDDHVIEAAHLCHPRVLSAAGEHPSRSFGRQTRPFDGSLSEPPPQARDLAFSERDLSDVRRALRSWARVEGLDREATGDLVLAVDEIATNSIRHGGGTGRLWMWREGGSLLCEIRDLGEMHDPLLGRIRPDRSRHAAAACGSSTSSATSSRSAPRTPAARSGSTSASPEGPSGRPSDCTISLTSWLESGDGGQLPAPSRDQAGERPRDHRDGR